MRIQEWRAAQALRTLQRRERQLRAEFWARKAAENKPTLRLVK